MSDVSGFSSVYDSIRNALVTAENSPAYSPSEETSEGQEF